MQQLKHHNRANQTIYLGISISDSITVLIEAYQHSMFRMHETSISKASKQGAQYVQKAYSKAPNVNQ
jgi:hypothetical protein